MYDWYKAQQSRISILLSWKANTKKSMYENLFRKLVAWFLNSESHNFIWFIIELTKRSKQISIFSWDPAQMFINLILKSLKIFFHCSFQAFIAISIGWFLSAAIWCPPIIIWSIFHGHKVNGKCSLGFLEGEKWLAKWSDKGETWRTNNI